MTRLEIARNIGTPLAVGAQDGQTIHDAIAPRIEENQIIEVSFAGVTSLTSAFLNVAIGQLYGKFSNNQIRRCVKIVDISQDDAAMLKRVTDRAKAYFSDPGRFDHDSEPVLS